MSSTTDKIKGVANEAAGAVKQSAGKAVGNPNLVRLKALCRRARAKPSRPLARPRMPSRKSSTRLELILS